VTPLPRLKLRGTNRSRFTARAFFFSNLLKYLVTFRALCSFVDLHGSCVYLHNMIRSEWIGESWIESAGEFRCWNRRLSPIAEFHRSMWVLSTALYRSLLSIGSVDLPSRIRFAFRFL
jgi:hypothetical protein